MTAPRKKYIVSVMARDRIGIIHDITRTIADMKGNLTDIRQQVLQGYFSMILYGSFPDTVSPETIRGQLLAVDKTNPFEISIKPVTEAMPPPAAPADSYVLTARGADRIGFVALVSGFCTEHDINILDLSTTSTGETYTMMLLVDLSKGAPLEELRTGLEQFNRQHDLSLLLQHHDIFKATNEIQL
ncbi:MAG: hypothetical protein L3J49_10810 [Desulfobulbaceae bacterium]|nr:hypothetical protein [Desulfobulbaceae bacterium]